MRYRLRFARREIGRWAARYPDSNEWMVEELAPHIRGAKFLAKDHFLQLCRWKSPRNQRWHRQNSAEYVKVVTGASFGCKNERFRIEALTLLKGVNWPTASAILHFASTDPYPIMDFRSLWSLCLEVPKRYDFALWWKYVQICRSLAERAGVEMRTLDRALWQFSKQNQRTL